MDDLTYAAAMVFGRQHYHAQRAPESLAESEQLAASIERAVWRETSGGVYGLRVEVDRDGVRLCGRCRTYYTKQKAQHAAMAVPGGGPLTNLIEVS